MSGSKRLAVVALVLAATLVACEGAALPGSQGINVGKAARDFSLETVDGKLVSLSDYSGSVVLVNFWATWCPPCRAEIPDFEVAYQAHKDDGFVVLGIEVGDSSQMVKPFVADLGMSYPVLLDESSTVMKEYRVPGLPTSLIVDRDGVIQVRHVGYLSAAKLDEYLAQVLP